MTQPIVGLHHVTAIASNPQHNLDFYTEILGLRLVKRTINFDDPGMYHFYFGDEAGTPGTILTFFPWPRASRGTPGVGEVTATSFSVPLASIDFWESHLASAGVLVERGGRRFEEEVLTLADPDGMRLEIVGHSDAGTARAWAASPVPAEHAIRGFFGVTLLEANLAVTTNVLEIMGLKKTGEDGTRTRFAAEGSALGNHIDIVVTPGAKHGRSGAGSVHHIAFRVVNDESQIEWRSKLLEAGLELTPVLDRTYFHSVYFREPGGVLFELATDPPGFTLDEPIESLGEALKLPEWMEGRRATIEGVLPPITLRASREVTVERQ